MSSLPTKSPNPAFTFLSDLIAIDSVNPSLVSGVSGEWDIGQRIAAELRLHAVDVHTFEVAPRRANVIGVIDAARPGRTLMLCGHMDTVGVEGMTDPFTPVEHGGRLYGRGAQDMKSGVAAMVGAAIELADSGGLPAGRLVVAAVVDEEHSSLGADALVGDWQADGAVVTEPTGLAIGNRSQGVRVGERQDTRAGSAWQSSRRWSRCDCSDGTGVGGVGGHRPRVACSYSPRAARGTVPPRVPDTGRTRAQRLPRPLHAESRTPDRDRRTGRSSADRGEFAPRHIGERRSRVRSNCRPDVRTAILRAT